MSNEEEKIICTIGQLESALTLNNRALLADGSVLHVDEKYNTWEKKNGTLKLCTRQKNEYVEAVLQDRWERPYTISPTKNKTMQILENAETDIRKLLDKYGRRLKTIINTKGDSPQIIIKENKDVIEVTYTQLAMLLVEYESIVTADYETIVYRDGCCRILDGARPKKLLMDPYKTIDIIRPKAPREELVKEIIINSILNGK